MAGKRKSPPPKVCCVAAQVEYEVDHLALGEDGSTLVDTACSGQRLDSCRDGAHLQKGGLAQSYGGCHRGSLSVVLYSFNGWLRGSLLGMNAWV
jgi:hypothetical protein